MGAESLSSSKGLKAQSQAADLKHLGFVPKYSTYFWNKGYGVASDLYSATKAYAPDSIKPRLGKLEETVTSYSTPMLTTMQDQGDKVLHVADSQLDSALDYAHRVSNGAYNNVNNLSSKDPAKQFSSARDTIIAKFQETINFVQQNGIAGTFKYTSNVAFQQAQHAKEFVYKSMSAGQEKYLQLHDTVVATPTYKKVVDTSNNLLKRMEESPPYKTTKDNLYPYIAPYADPAWEKIASSPYYKAAMDHLKPLPAHEKPMSKAQPNVREAMAA